MVINCQRLVPVVLLVVVLCIVVSLYCESQVEGGVERCVIKLGIFLWKHSFIVTISVGLVLIIYAFVTNQCHRSLCIVAENRCPYIYKLVEGSLKWARKKMSLDYFLECGIEEKNIAIRNEKQIMVGTMNNIKNKNAQTYTDCMFFIDCYRVNDKSDVPTLSDLEKTMCKEYVRAERRMNEHKKTLDEYEDHLAKLRGTQLMESPSQEMEPLTRRHPHIPTSIVQQ